MHTHPQLERLEQIARSLQTQRGALALIGLGSCGVEIARMDAWSDLDFFVLVERGFKSAYLDDLGWLSSLCPLAYAFANTRDGYKVLFADGIFCEFGVFEPGELSEIPYAAGRMVWKRPEVPDALRQPAAPPVPPLARDADWLLGEALTNLLVGLGREQRGERLSAARFIQGYAVERVLELIEAGGSAPAAAPLDVFDPPRRFEQRHPAAAAELGSWMQGYARNRQSALCLLDWLERRYPVNPALAARIRALAAAP
ncbi:MAG: hypothetical protein AB1453_07255 [Chloroflexota bacterium]|jgi:hypothetical protein